MNFDRTQRIRRAAILVASLEETLAEQMLECLPRLEATRILDEVDRLGELDPDELEDVLNEFRTAGLRGRPVEDAVEFTYSAPIKLGLTEPHAVASRDTAEPHGANSYDEADAELMAELLGHESAQTIAVALSRLEQHQGAAVFAALPGGLQVDVLDRLANLETADEGAVTELQSQLLQRVLQHRQRQQRAAESAELARRMVVKTEPGQRESLLARLSSRQEPQVGESRPELAAAARMAKPRTASLDFSAAGGFEVWAEEIVTESAKPQVRDGDVLEDQSRELESLGDRALLEALRVADERTVQCALAASSERFLNRVASKLPRRQANRLRQVVRAIGPTRLAELRQAQYELLRIARECHAGGIAAR